MKLLIYILFLAPGVVSSQALVEESMLKIKSDSGQEVIVYKGYDCDQCYYYLPSALRISKRKESSVPEISLVTWKNDEASQIIGGIFHFLIEWGLTAEDERVTQQFIRSECDSLAVLVGPVLVHAPRETVVIHGKDRLAEILKASITNTAEPSTMPGSKMAFSFRFTENEIGDFLTHKNSPGKSTTSLQATYTYEVRTFSGQQQKRNITLSLPFKEILKLVKE